MTVPLQHRSVATGSKRVSVRTDAECAPVRIEAVRRAHAPHADSTDRIGYRRTLDSTELGARS